MKPIPAFLVLLLVSLTSISYGEGQPKESAADIVKRLKFQKGEIVLKNGLATLKVPNDLQFLNASDSVSVLVDLWGNPPMHEPPLGMLMPELSPDSWGVIITYEEEGYVKDHDADTIEYPKLLAQMQKNVLAANGEREKLGFHSLELIGWAAPPRYDKATHKLFWAKELKVAGSSENTLNYNIRMLGRRGVLVLNAVGAMSQLPEIEQASPKILAAIDFNPGNRYADFSEAAGDKIASYGLAALVAGGVAAKLGFFKGLWVLALGAKKFVIIGVVAIVAWFKKLFGKKGEAALKG